MKFKIDDGNEISIPSCLADSNLSLAEIGALFCFVAMSETGEGIARFNQAELLAAADSLKKRGILTIGFSDNNLSIHIDLDKVQPMEAKP